MEKTIKLSGWQAVVAIVIIAIIGGCYYIYMTETLNTDGVEVLQMHLKNEYLRNVTSEISDAMKNPEGKEAELSKLTSKLDKFNIEIVSVKARRGKAPGRDNIYIVRAEIRIDGNTPSESMDIRYFKMEYSMMSGWRVYGDSFAWAYYTSFKFI